MRNGKGKQQRLDEMWGEFVAASRAVLSAVRRTVEAVENIKRKWNDLHPYANVALLSDSEAVELARQLVNFNGGRPRVLYLGELPELEKYGIVEEQWEDREQLV